MNDMQMTNEDWMDYFEQWSYEVPSVKRGYTYTHFPCPMCDKDTYPHYTSVGSGTNPPIEMELKCGCVICVT